MTAELPAGSVLRPDISYDGKRVLFAHCKYYPGLADEPNKLDKNNVPEDAFYHLYEMNLDGTRSAPSDARQVRRLRRPLSARRRIVFLVHAARAVRAMHE